MTDKKLKANSGNLQLGDVVTVDQTNSRLGIGTPSPACKLDIKTTNTSEECFRHTADYGTTTGRYYSLTAPSVDSIQEPFVWATGNSHAWYVDNQERMRIDFTGKVFLGASTASGSGKLLAGPTRPVTVWRNNQSASYPTFTVQRSAPAAGGQVYIALDAGATDIDSGATNIGGIWRNLGNTAFEFFGPSDERLKNVKGEFSAALEKVVGIPVKWYSWKTNPEQEHFRFIAQDVQKHIPSAVFEDEEGYLQLGESDMFPILWQAVRELKAELDEAKARIQTLEGGA